jgi:hypothetical protein
VRVTPEAWKKASKILAGALEEIEALGTESAAGTTRESDDGERHAIAVMMLFEAAAPGAFVPEDAHPVEHDEYDDLAAPGHSA